MIAQLILYNFALIHSASSLLICTVNRLFGDFAAIFDVSKFRLFLELKRCICAQTQQYTLADVQQVFFVPFNTLNRHIAAILANNSDQKRQNCAKLKKSRFLRFLKKIAYSSELRRTIFLVPTYIKFHAISNILSHI